MHGKISKQDGQLLPCRACTHVLASSKPMQACMHACSCCPKPTSLVTVPTMSSLPVFCFFSAMIAPLPWGSACSSGSGECARFSAMPADPRAMNARK